MTDPESQLPISPETPGAPDSPEPSAETPVPADTPTQPPRRRFRRFLFLAACVAFILIAGPVGFYIWANSEATQDLARRRLITTLEEATGGRVQIATFHWNLLNMEAEAGGLVIHGHEADSETPFARADHLRAAISILGIFSPRILLRDLEIDRPAFHVIVYADGSTNVPQPATPPMPHAPYLDTLFNLQAGHVSVQQGTLDFEDRATEFDFQNRFTLLDLDARDVSVLMRYAPPSGGNPETYRVETGAGEINLVRGKEKPALGSLQATLDLTRSAAFLRSFSLTSSYPGAKNHSDEQHTLHVTGAMQDFSNPRWQAHIDGELDLRLLAPTLGYPFVPQGDAQVDLNSAGEAGEFRIDGTVHAVDIAYVGTGVDATGVLLDAHVHADPRRLLISNVVARLHQGGQLTGQVDLSPWLPHSTDVDTFQRAGIHDVRARGPEPLPARPHVPPPDVINIPVNGKVTAEFHDVSLDVLMDIVGQPPFQRLGLDTRINGAANAHWVKGDQQTVVADAALTLNQPAQALPGETPASGAIDATYTQATGAADVRKLEVNTPASQIEAHGLLGAYPLTSPSGLTVDFQSRNLAEFDAVLRDLGLTRNGKAGAAALPIALNGQGEFHGAWTGSLVDPHLAGDAKATQLAIEIPMLAAKPGLPATSRMVNFDTAEATGSYDAQRISIAHSLFHRGKSQIALDGTLDATAGREPTYDENSILHAHLHASDVAVEDLQTIASRTLPATGTLNAQLQLNGPLHAPDGSGWGELDNGSAYGEPITRLRAEGTLNASQLRFASISATAPAGDLAAAGSYDLKSNRFQIEADGTGIDLAKIDSLRRQDAAAAGKLAFTVKGAGTLDDPRLEAHATLNGFGLGGEALGTLVFDAHTANRAAIYEATTRLEGAEVVLKGKTDLGSGYQTQASLTFSKFDIGGLLKSSHLQALTGQSALAGELTVQGPLAHPLEMRGDARLQQLALSVANVALQSQGGMHATLANGRVTLDPLHITGEDTDMHLEGSLELKDKQQLNLAASGSVNLKLAETIDSDITSSGTSTFQVEAHGTLTNPGLRGRVDFQNGSISLEDVPNGLSQLHGTLAFNQDRLEVQSLTAMSGGGLLSVGGYLAYQRGIYADLSVTGKGVRIRYPQGVSSLADTTLHLQGTQNNLLLSGDVLITRFSVSSDLDIAALAAQANSAQVIAPPDAPSNHIRYDVHVQSSPQLNFQNAYAKLAGNVDLHLRGTVASPSLLGQVSITEGNAIIAGTRYDLQRGDIVFSNPVRIEPTIDLSATARVEDYDITLALHGTPQKLAVTYRSDPPLPEADVVALLALGRTENQQRLYTQQQEQSVANPTTDALLGGALNATVSSRVQKLFGAGSVKVDPNYIGTLGNSTSRITVEEQLGRSITLTYATNVDTTGEQLLQAEIAINRHVSLLVARDESGVFSMVIKATRRYR